MKPRGSIWRWVLARVMMIAVCAVIAIAFFSISPDDEVTSLAPKPPSPSIAPAPEIPTITYTAKGFSPSEASVKAGELLRIANGTGATIQIESNPHPAHTDNPELNVGSLSAGASRTLTVDRKGSFKIHNEFSPNINATITVK